MEILTSEYLRSYRGRKVNLTEKKLSFDQIRSLADNRILTELNISNSQLGGKEAIILASNISLKNYIFIAIK